MSLYGRYIFYKKYLKLHKMSEITVNDLPSEIIINILRFLDQENLRNATLTCKLWRSLIESSFRWSLELYHNSKSGCCDEPWIDFMLTTNRKFQTIELNMLHSIERNKIIEIFKRHGVNVVKLCLINSCIDNFTKFAELLKCMPNLRHVIIFTTSSLCGVSDLPPESDLPDLKKLVTLEMVASEYSIIKCFQRGKLTTLKILNSYHGHSLVCRPLEDFLKSQDCLTALAFRSIHHDTSTLFQTEKLNTQMPFQLTQLSLLNIILQEESPNNYNNLLKFLKAQAKTLKELELGRHFPDFILEFVFANMKTLNTLSLIMTAKDKEFYERLDVNRSIDQLKLLDSTDYSDRDVQFFRDFLKKLPNIRSLFVLEYCKNEALLAIAQSLHNLETLVITYLNGDIVDGVQFPNLTSLHIQGLGPKIIDWNKFTEINSQLTDILIERILDRPYFNTDHIEQITTNISLHSLRLGHHFTADDRFFEIIRKKCPDLKVLDLHKSCKSNELKDQSDLNVLRWCSEVKCPKKLTLWNEDDYHGRFPSDQDYDQNIDEDFIDEDIFGYFTDYDRYDTGY